MPRKLVMTYYPDGFVPAEVLAANDISVEYRLVPLKQEEGLAEAAQDADVVIVAGEQHWTRRVMEQLPGLRGIVNIGIGYDHTDLAAATDLGIVVAYNPHYCVEDLADHAISLILTCARQVMPLDRAIRAGRWVRMVAKDLQENVLYPVKRLSSSTVGIVGYGNAGSMLVKRARGLGMRVITHTKYPERPLKEDVPVVPLDQLCREADFISLHASLTPQTRGIIGREQLRLMKPTAFIVNTARGPLIDEEALVTALSERWIAGAALDVMVHQPLPLDSPLLGLDNLVMTPHCAYYSPESTEGLHRIPCEEAARILTGQWPVAMLNPAVKQKYVERWGPMREPD